jgi:para-aminobenzoate synthetase component 1
MNEWGKAEVPFLFVVDFDGRKPVALPLSQLEKAKIFFEMPGKAFYPKEIRPPGKVFFRKHPLPYEDYLRGFEVVRRHIGHGDTFLLNYTCTTPIETNLTLRDIFRQSQAKYKLLFKNRFTCFSPETFVQMNDQKIFTFPMKGTIDASLPGAEARILADPKETAEHYTIVDLLRNDLSMVATRVQVRRFRYVEKVETHDKHLLQVSSEICGELPAGWRAAIGDIFYKLLPAGSVSGAPKRMTLDIIRKAETSPRGYYTGVFGIFDGQSVDTGVMIRFIEKTGGGLQFRSGGGITCFSDPALEYREMIDKVYLAIPQAAT